MEIGLLRRVSNNRRYEKPWMKKKRLKNERIYKSKIGAVNQLKSYVKFLQDHGQNIDAKK